MPRISTNQIAMGLDTAGALIDVSSYVEFDEGIDYSYGKQDQYRSQPPGKWSFTLNNYDGRFTPGSSTYATPVAEGMQVSWLLGARLVVGTILLITPRFDGNQSSWARVDITVDDALGDASRTDIDDLADSINEAGGRLAFFRMDGDENTSYADDELGNLPDLGLNPFTVAPPNANPVMMFGQPPVPGLKDKQVALFASAEINYFQSLPRGGTQILYPQSTLGGWGFWFTPDRTTQFGLDVQIAGLGTFITLSYGPNGSFTLFPGSGTFLQTTITPGLNLYRPHYWAFSTATTFSAGAWTVTVSMYIDGALIGSRTYSNGSTITSLTNTDRQPVMVRFAVGDGVNAISAVVGRLSHTLAPTNEYLAIGGTEALRLQALDAVVPTMTLDTLPGALSTEPIGYDHPNGSVLDALNDVIKTEQGYMWTAGTGTLLSPSQVVRLRARERPTKVTASFDVERELDQAPVFVRDASEMIVRDVVTGPNGSRTYYDATGTGTASGSDTVLFSTPADMEAWAQDRFIRGKNVNLRPTAIVIDALTTPTDRSAAILALKPGDRVRLTNLPATQLGITTWDGWLIGMSESHSVTSYKFTLFLAPVINLTASRWAAGGATALASSVTSGATSFVVNTNPPSFATPYTILVDSEQMEVTNVVAATSTSWTMTVTRAVNGTTAASHASAAPIEVFPWVLFGSGADLYLVSSVTSGATSMSLNTKGAGVPTTAVPFPLLIDNEQVLVTAVSAGPPWTLTVTRGASGTTAAAHSAGSLPEVPSAPTFVF